MILEFRDQDGDPVAVESAAITGLSVGSVARPHRSDVDLTVTLIWTGGSQPLMAAAPFAEVLAAWKLGREQAGPPPLAYPHAKGWEVQYPQLHPSCSLPGAPAGWDTKALTASKEVEG